MNREETLKKLRMMLRENEVRHFSAEELLVHTEEPENALPTPRMLVNIMPTVIVADRIRDKLGVPLIVTSAYRAPAYNRLVGGGTKSQHQLFTALDLVPKPKTDSSVKNLHELALEARGELFEAVWASSVPAGVGTYFPHARLDWWQPFPQSPDLPDIFRFAGGVGRYSWGVHLDTRGINHTWGS